MWNRLKNLHSHLTVKRYVHIYVTHTMNVCDLTDSSCILNGQKNCNDFTSIAGPSKYSPKKVKNTEKEDL